MRNISLRDLMLALPQFKNEIDLINPANDAVVFATLDAIGFDTRRGVQYVPSYHRDMQRKCAVGYQAVGEYNTHPKYNKFIDTIDRVIIAGQLDPSLGRDLEELMGKRYTYKNQDEQDVKSRKRPNDPRYYSDDELLEMGYSDGEDDEEEWDYVEDNCTAIESQIKVLEDVRNALRGKS